MDWVGLLFSPIKPFVAHPERIIAMATALLVVFGVLGFARGRWPWSLLWATGLWVAFAIWEWLIPMPAEMLFSGHEECPIAAAPG